MFLEEKVIVSTDPAKIDSKDDIELAAQFVRAKLMQKLERELLKGNTIVTQLTMKYEKHLPTSATADGIICYPHSCVVGYLYIGGHENNLSDTLDAFKTFIKQLEV